MTIGVYIVLGILVAIVFLLAFAIIKSHMKKYRIVEVKPKKKRMAKKPKRKRKHLHIGIW